MREDYAAAYGDLAARHWWWRARRRWVLERIEELAPEGGWGRILDVGCGGGQWFDDLERFGRVEGVDPDPSPVDSGDPESGRIHLRPFDERFRPGHRYGLVLFLDVLEHMADPVAALDQAARLLEPDGRVLITVPAFEALWTRHDDLNRHHRRYTRASLSRQVGDAGLSVAEARYFFHWLFVPKLVLRGVESLTAARATVPRVPPAPVNGLLYGLSRLEQKLTSAAHPPFGSSLYLAAGTSGASEGGG